MTFSRAKIAGLAALLLVLAAAGWFAYTRYSRATAAIAAAVSENAARKLGRQVRFAGVKASPLDGVTIISPEVSNPPSFGKGVFFKAKAVRIKPELKAALSGRAFFDAVELDSPVFNVREKGGKWNFDDLLALIPETDKGLYLTWNARRVAVRGGELRFDSEGLGQSFTLENASIDLGHYSSHGGNFSLEAAGDLKTLAKGKLFSSAFSMDTDLNFEYAGLSSASGGFRLKDAHLGEVAMSELGADWKLFGLRKPAPEKNYSAEVFARGIVVPGYGNEVKAGIDTALDLLSKVLGKKTPAIDDARFDELKLSFRLNKSRLEIPELLLRSNFLDVDASMLLDGPAGAGEVSFAADAKGAGKTRLKASGPLDRPSIEPELSYTLNARLGGMLRDLYGLALKYFPVTKGANANG